MKETIRWKKKSENTGQANYLKMGKVGEPFYMAT
jgi:hypothetical protein